MPQQSFRYFLFRGIFSGVFLGVFLGWFQNFRPGCSFWGFFLWWNFRVWPSRVSVAGQGFLDSELTPQIHCCVCSMRAFCFFCSTDADTRAVLGGDAFHASWVLEEGTHHPDMTLLRCPGATGGWPTFLSLIPMASAPFSFEMRHFTASERPNPAAKARGVEPGQ